MSMVSKCNDEVEVDRLACRVRHDVTELAPALHLRFSVLENSIVRDTAQSRCDRAHSMQSCVIRYRADLPR